MSNFDKNMEKIFDVAPVEKEEQPLVPVEQKSAVENLDLKQDLVDAYDQSKSNLQQLIDTGKEGLDEILQIAKAGQHPRAFEVFATLLKNVGELNDKLIDNQKKVREVEGKKNNGADTKIDKAIFVGSTAELSKLLKGKE
jgi:uncharacterized protein YicC (UPF0701 family)